MVRLTTIIFINHIHKYFRHIRLRLLRASWLAISGKVTTLSAETQLSVGRDSETGSGCARRESGELKCGGEWTESHGQAAARLPGILFQSCSFYVRVIFHYVQCKKQELLTFRIK